MRRADREIKNIEEMKDILSRADACRVALVDGTKPYAVTLNYGFEWEGSLPSLYFHCARSGRKLDIIAKNPAACAVVDLDHELVGGPMGCDWGMKFRSVVIDGVVEIVTDPEERAKGLDLLMAHYTGRTGFAYEAAEMSATVVLRFRAQSITGKKKV